MKRQAILFSFVSIPLILITACGSEKNKEWLHQEIISAQQQNPDIKECPNLLKRPKKIIVDVDRNTDTPYVDNDKELKSLSTDIVVREFFTTKDTLFNFISLINQTLDERLADYRASKGLDDSSMFFIFKGGNVLRMVANSFLSSLPATVRDLLQDKYAEFFKRSDTDLSIIIDEKRLDGLNYNKVMDEVLMLAFDTLQDIRKEFFATPEKYFNFLQLKPNFARKELDNYLDQMDELKAVNDPENSDWYKAKFLQLQLLDVRATELPCNYKGNYDYKYEIDQKTDKLIVTPLSKKPSWIVNTRDKTLEWNLTKYPEKIIKFYLARSKVQFEYTFEKDGKFAREPIGGELIDISIPHRKSYNLRTFLDNYDQWVTTYTLTYKETNTSIIIKSETIEGLAADLHDIIFDQTFRPWEVRKYEKRVKRLLFFALIEMTRSWGLGSKMAKDYVEAVKNNVLAPLYKLYPLDDNDVKDLAKEAEEGANRITKIWSELKIANNVWQALVELAKEVLIKAPVEDDETEFSLLLKNVEENLDIIQEINDREYPQPDLDKIYDINISDLH
jgi:hypothetical protein